MKYNKKVLWIDIVPTIVTAILILYFAIDRDQSLIKTLPTLITLVVQLLLVRANKAAFLLGGANAILYGLIFFSESLYFSALNAVVVSAPIQFFSYFNWNRKIRKGEKYIGVLKMPMRLLIIALSILGWVFCLKYLSKYIPFGRYIGADSFIFVLGLVVPILSAFGYIESQYINIACCVVSLGMWIVIMIEEPQNINFVLISVYNLFRVLEATISWTHIFKSNITQEINT